MASVLSHTFSQSEGDRYSVFLNCSKTLQIESVHINELMAVSVLGMVCMIQEVFLTDC